MAGRRCPAPKGCCDVLAKARPDRDLPRTLEEFDRWHAKQPERWEFINGYAVMLTPAALPHTIIKGNIFHQLVSRLDQGPCWAFVDGAQVRSRDLSAIPDVVVACSGIDPTTPVIAQPTLIVEINSPSTERDDTHRKWQGYCLIPSLRHYMIVAQEIRFVTLHTRVGAFEWTERVYEEGIVDLEALGASLSFDEIYRGVTFPAEPPVFHE